MRSAGPVALSQRKEKQDNDTHGYDSAQDERVPPLAEVDLLDEAVDEGEARWGERRSRKTDTPRAQDQATVYKVTLYIVTLTKPLPYITKQLRK